jgi:dTMP kinase
MSVSRGRFITLEGGEGAGKSTLARALAENLRAQGIDVVCTREPGGTPLAERLRELLLQADGERLDPTAETLLMFAGRALHLQNLIEPALQRGAWVLCDRFSDASFAYQGAGRGVPLELIATLATQIHGQCWPDCTLLLDLPVAAGLQRARARGADADRFEREGQDFFERVRSAYLERARREPQRIKLLDASLPPAAVLTAALALLAPWLPKGLAR